MVVPSSLKVLCDSYIKVRVGILGCGFVDVSPVALSVERAVFLPRSLAAAFFFRCGLFFYFSFSTFVVSLYYSLSCYWSLSQYDCRYWEGFLTIRLSLFFFSHFNCSYFFSQYFDWFLKSMIADIVFYKDHVIVIDPFHNVVVGIHFSYNTMSLLAWILIIKQLLSSLLFPTNWLSLSTFLTIW